MSEEKVLFELRITEDERGTHVEVTESPEWQAYHAPHPPGHRILAWADDCCEPLRNLGRRVRRAVRRPTEHELRHALDSLQGIYDDLYGQPVESES